MTLIITLFAIGLICLFFEVFTPGGILGAIAGVVFFIACALVWYDHGTVYGLTSMCIALVLSGTTVWAELFLLPKTKFGQRMFNNASITGASQPPPASPDEVLGRECISLTVLAPTGYVSLNGKRYEARSLDGYIEKGTFLIINSLDNFTLQVTKK